MLRMLSENEILEMQTLAYKMLEVSGVRFDTEESRELFKKHGLRVEDNRVYFTADVIDAAIKADKKVVNYDPSAPKEIYVSALGTVPSIYDAESDTVRKGTIEDVVRSYKLQATNDIYSMEKVNIIEATGYGDTHPCIGQVALALKYMNKGNKFSLMRVTAEHCVDKDIYGTQREVIQYLNAFYDNDASYYACFCPMSPLSYDEEVLKNIDACMDEGVPDIALCPCTLANMSGPASVRGLVIHDIAIALAGLVYIKLRNPEVNASIANASAMTDLRALQPSYGSPESIYMSVMFYEYFDYFGIESSILGGMTDAIKPTYQAGIETAMTAVLPFMLTDINWYFCYTGFMGGFYCGSFEKMILDEDLVGYLNRILDGTTIAVGKNFEEEMVKGVSTDYYLTRRTPSDYRKDYFLPKHFCKLVGAGRNAEPEKADIIVRAQLEIKRREETYQFPDRSEFQKKMLNKYLPIGYKY